MSNDVPRSDEQLIADCLAHNPGADDPGLDAVEELDDLVRDEPLRALSIVREILRRSPSGHSRRTLRRGRSKT
jgi:hypothetical protein